MSVLALVVAHLALAALLPLVSARSRRGAFALAAVPPAAALLWALAHAPEALAGGVSSILNFAPAVLLVPDHVEVRKVDMSIELQILAFHEQRKIGPRSLTDQLPDLPALAEVVTP